jgi:hypothetical protein
LIDPHSETWRDVEAWAKAEIEYVRDELEKPVAYPTHDHWRGRAAVLRHLLTFAQRPAEVHVDPAPDYGA